MTKEKQFYSIDEDEEEELEYIKLKNFLFNLILDEKCPLWIYRPYKK